MNPPELGKLLNGNEERDAIHIAIVPLEAATPMYSSTPVGVTEEGKASDRARPLIGIVDPFLNDAVDPGDRVWVFLYPNSITSLRHSWSHPVLDKPKEKPSGEETESHAWARSFADHCGLTFWDLMSAAEAYLDSGDYLSDGGRFEGVGVPDEFWDHYESITGRKVSPRERGTFFSCAC